MGARLTIEQMQAVARERGGKCLSQEYGGTNRHLWWECSEGHQWEASPRNVIHNSSWCPHCAGTRPLGIELMHAVAKERGGKCLSATYANSKTPLLWECAQWHRWESTPNIVVTQGSWCPHCAGTKPLGIELMHAVAKERGGQCLSQEYKGVNRYLCWECGEGHRWEATPNSVIQAVNWCPVCSPRHVPPPPKLGLALMNEIAQERGGKCLSTKYINIHTPLMWECSRGHRWETQPNNIIHQRNWCRECVETAPLGIERMRELARERGGKCLSATYANNKTPLLWECAQGHRWETRPVTVKKGTWCPVCARTRTVASARSPKVRKR